MKNLGVSLKAEKVANGLAVTFLVLGWLEAIFAIAFPYFAGWGDYSDFWLSELVGIFAGAAFACIGYLFWALIKLVVNMSLNLNDINAHLQNNH